MKIREHKGPLPQQPKHGGRKRIPSPFDEPIAKGGVHEVELEMGDDPLKIRRQIQGAARYAKKSARVVVTESGTLVFEVRSRQTRNSTRVERIG